MWEQAAAAPRAGQSSSRMRILHCFKVYRPDHNGGIEEAMSRIVAGAPTDFESSILVCRTRGLGSTIMVDGCPVERTSTFGSISSVPLSPGYIWRLRRRLRDVDLLALHAPFPLIDLGIRNALRADQGLVIHWHSEIVGREWLRPLFGPVVERSVERADRIMVTDETMIGISPHLSKVREKCRAAPYGIDTRWWTDLNEGDRAAIDELRRRYPRLVVGCGRMVPYKGFDVLIRAMAEINGHLILIGTGPRLDELRKQANALGVGERVTFAGFIDRDEQRRILNAARVFTLPSVTEAEAFGIAQLEAMCCALPVVNTSLPTTVPHVARHGQEGLTVEPGDPKGLAAAINRLLDDSDMATRLGRAGQARAHEKYDWRTYAAACAQTYREVLEERRATRGR